MYRKIIKIVLGILIDCVIIRYSLFLILFFGQSISTLPHPEYKSWAFDVAILVFYIAFACFNRGITPGIKLIIGRKEKSSTTVSARKIAFATFLDWFSIYSLMLLLNLVLRQFVFINVYVLFTLVAFLYYVVSFLIMKQTFGYIFCQIELVSKQKNNSTWIATILKRELFKFGLGAWLPFVLYGIVFKEGIFFLWHTPYFLFFNMLFLLFYYVAKGEAWWNSIGKTEAQPKNNTRKFQYLFWFGYMACMGLIFLVFLLYNNSNNNSSEKLLGFNVPFKKIEYPDNSKVKPYVAFLKEHAQDPKEYLLSLFDKYDIVVLCENLHCEDTQWDFIYEVVTDTQFVKKAGHIFTEYGCVKDQPKVDSFMQTSFADSVSIAQATATLLDYMYGNFYSFMRKLYYFNQTLPDSMRIQEHFTDILSEKYLSAAYYDTMLNNRNIVKYNRDSLMAQVVIDWYEQTKGKCLVVTNYRHAFAFRNTTDMELYGNEAQYIYTKFPKKMTNVLFHGCCSNGIYQAPIRHGLWNRAMKNNGNIPVGFNLEGSPFGKDKFDMYPPERRNIFQCSFQDVFMGYIFYKPEKEYTCSASYFARYAAEEEYEWAMQHHLIDSVQGKKLVNRYKNTGGKMANTVLHPVLYINLYHFVDLLLWGLWGGIVLCIVIGSLLRIVVKNRLRQVEKTNRTFIKINGTFSIL